MNDRVVVRWLIVIQAVFPILGGISNVLFHRGLPADLRALVDQNMAMPGPAWLVGLLVVILAVTWVFAAVSLFNFRPGAGKFYLIVSALGVLPMPFLPPTYSSWVTQWTDGIGALAVGMTIAWILLGHVPEQEHRVEAPTGQPA